jgi:hypothetical protein
MNFIDQFLQQPKQNVKTAAHKGAEDFLDLASTRTYHKAVGSVHAAAVVDGDSELAEAAENVQKKAAGSETILRERALSDAEIQGYIKKLLNDGVTPKDVEARLGKLAQLNSFDRSMSSSFLDGQAGILGLAYIEPNAYMDSCPDSYQRQEVKLGGVRAKSVKQIAACEGCQHFQKSASAKRCNLYRLPIVSSQAELLPIINNLIPQVKTARLFLWCDTQAGKWKVLDTNDDGTKTVFSSTKKDEAQAYLDKEKGKTGKAKKAALVALANRENIKAPTAKNAKDETAAPFTRNTTPVAVRSAGDARPVAKQASFTALDVAKAHQAGKPLHEIYTHAVKTAGTQQADAAVKRFIQQLKHSKLKVALSQIDCTKLGGKLSSANAILGEKKCGSCSYRTGMHCGLTGGTLLSFPGMDKTATNHRIAEGALKDGTELVKGFDLAGIADIADIDIKEPSFAEIDELSPPSITF